MRLTKPVCDIEILCNAIKGYVKRTPNVSEEVMDLLAEMLAMEAVRREQKEEVYQITLAMYRPSLKPDVLSQHKARLRELTDIVDAQGKRINSLVTEFTHEVRRATDRSLAARDLHPATVEIVRLEGDYAAELHTLREWRLLANPNCNFQGLAHFLDIEEAATAPSGESPKFGDTSWFKAMP